MDSGVFGGRLNRRINLMKYVSSLHDKSADDQSL